MVEDRPQDWDWVKATHECSALVMFGVLKTLASRDVQRRNQQLGHETFKLNEINGIEFSVTKATGSLATRVFFKVKDDLARVSVERGQAPPDTGTVYTVGLADNGTCTFRLGTEQLAPWQVLKSSLEWLLFG